MKKQFFNGAGEKRKFFNNLRHFGGTRQISIAALGLMAFFPLLIFVFGFLMLSGWLKTHNAAMGETALMSFMFGGIMAGKKKLMHGAMATALAVGLAATPAAAASSNQPTPQQLNDAQRKLVLNNSVEMRQQIYSQAINPATQAGPISVPVKNVGLVKRFKVIISGVIQNTDDAIDAVGTPYGIQNVFSNIQFQDLNQTVRINTHGPHLANLNTVKGRFPYGSSIQTSAFNGTAPLQSMSGEYGANFPVLVNLNGVVHGTNKAFRMVYDVPLAYNDEDLRGAIYMNVLNAQASLNLTLNNGASAFVATAGDDTFAILRSGTCSYLGNVTVTVYQVYLDQLPQNGNGGPILPSLDISTIYELKNATFKGIANTQDFPIPYANYRDFVSTFAIYNNTGDNAGHGIGADINYWSLQSANLTNIWKEDPLTVAQNTRDILGVDLPVGTYYFSNRRKPLSTLQYGNMALVLNTAVAGANAYLNICWEDFGMVNTVTQAGSLAGAA